MSWPRRVHSGPYPHVPACQGCRTRGVCSTCGRGLRNDGACTHARCRRCCGAICRPSAPAWSASLSHAAGTFEQVMIWLRAYHAGGLSSPGKEVVS